MAICLLCLILAMHLSRTIRLAILTALLLASTPGWARADSRSGNPSNATNQKVDRAVRQSVTTSSGAGRRTSTPTNIVWGTGIVWGTKIVWGDRVIGQMAGDTIVWGTSLPTGKSGGSY